MADPVVAQKAPYPVAIEEGKTYYWCSCGLSKAQPFCDGSHKGSALSPTRYTATQDGTVYFCGCKRSGKAPLCDGAHRTLSA